MHFKVWGLKKKKKKARRHACRKCSNHRQQQWDGKGTRTLVFLSSRTKFFFYVFFFPDNFSRKHKQPRLPAIHCALQFSGVALAILMGRSGVLGLIGWERYEGVFTEREQVSKAPGGQDDSGPGR